MGNNPSLEEKFSNLATQENRLYLKKLTPLNQLPGVPCPGTAISKIASSEFKGTPMLRTTVLYKRGLFLSVSIKNPFLAFLG